MRLSYHSDENTLRLTLDHPSEPAVDCLEMDGMIDIAEQGRLVGIEIDTGGIDLVRIMAPWLENEVAGRYVELESDAVYVTLTTPDERIPAQHIRTAGLRLRMDLDRAGHLAGIAIPRRGNGYEISFPSGNQ